LLAAEDQLDRSAGGERERRDVTFEMKVAFGTEPAAEERHDHPYVRLGNLEDVCDSAPRGERHLRRRPHGHAVALPLREDRARLDRSALRAAAQVTAPHNTPRPRA